MEFLHVDMDYFFAAVEMRDNPHLKGKCVAVSSMRKRSVLATCNYEARKYGLHSGMPTFKAKERCPSLVILPLNFQKYKDASEMIYNIFKSHTPYVTMYSLDEGLLAVPAQENMLELALKISSEIQEKTHLSCSVGIAPLRFLAKIASGMNKPNQITLIPAKSVDSFLQALPVEKIPGVGHVFQTRLAAIGIHTCGEVRKWESMELYKCFGKAGLMLYDRSWGQETHKENKSGRTSLSVEQTFEEDITNIEELKQKNTDLYVELKKRNTRYQNKYFHRHKVIKTIKTIFIVMKFADFKSITRQEKFTQNVEKNQEVAFASLLKKTYKEYKEKNIRLLGLGYHFEKDERLQEKRKQIDLFHSNVILS